MTPILFDAANVRDVQLVDPLLTGIARQYRPEGYIADEVAPRVTVMRESGKYVVYDKRAFFASDEDYLRADGSQAKEIDLQISKESYVVEEYAVKTVITDRERSNADDPVRLESSKVNLLLDQLAIAREKRVATRLRVSGGQLASGNTATPSNNWDVDAATIETDIVTGIEAVADDIGRKPNTIVLPWKVANAVAKQQDIREVIKYTVNGQSVLNAGSGILPPELWGLRVLVASAYHTTDKEGDTSVSLSQIWGDDVRILYVNPAAGWGNPSVAYTFQTQGPVVRRWREDSIKGEYIEVSEIVDERVTAPEAGYDIVDVLS